jgi:hypothetical protein
MTCRSSALRVVHPRGTRTEPRHRTARRTGSRAQVSAAVAASSCACA